MRYLKKEYGKMSLYSSPAITEGIILNANENPYGIPKEMNDYLKENIDSLSLHRYPNIDSVTLKKEIAKHYQISPKMVVTGVGSDELLDLIIRATISSEYILCLNPSFSMYKQFASINLAKYIEVDFDSNFDFDITKIKQSINKYDPKLIFICSPNNPTGKMIPIDDLREICIMTNGIVVIDEAYVEFASRNQLHLINEFTNVIIFRTFSKAFALAGIRCGYAIANEDLINLINVVKPPYNISKFSEISASYAISHKELFIPSIEKIKQTRENVYEKLKKMNIEVYNSEANFLLMKLGLKTYEKLVEKKIHVRTIKYNNEFFYRVTIGIEEEMNEFLHVIEESI